jgi:hypothetical protein
MYKYCFLELFPAIHCNLFCFKEKQKRIFVSIGAISFGKETKPFFCLDFHNRATATAIQAASLKNARLLRIAFFAQG